MAHVTIPDQASYVTYAAQTGTGPFTVPFAIFEKADLSVTVGSTELGQSDFSYAETSSTTGGFQTGEITLGVAAAAEDILIYRKVNPKRTTDFAIGPLAPNAINSALDRIHAQLQDNKRDLDRALKLDFGDTATAAQVADMLALGAIIPQIEQVADIDAEVVITAGLASSISEIAAALPTMEIIAREIDPFDTLAALRAASGSSFVTGSIARTKGYASATDGCGGVYVIVDALPTLSDGNPIPVDNTGCVNALTGSKWAIHLEYHLNKRINQRMFGVKNDGTSQDTAIDRIWDCYANLSQLNPGSSPYSFTWGRKLPEQPEIEILPGPLQRATYAVREFDFENFVMRCSPGSVFVKQGFRFKGNNGYLEGLRSQGSNTANSWGLHFGDADLDVSEGTQYWTVKDCFVEKFAVNWVFSYDVESSFINCQGNEALLHNRVWFRASDQHWQGWRGTRAQGKVGSLIQPWGTGAFAINVGGLHFHDDAERKAEGRQVFITGGDGTTALTTSDDAYLYVPNGYASVKVAAAWECYIHDADWANDAEESKTPVRRQLTVTAMAQSPDNAAHTRVTVSTAHYLSKGVDIGHDYYQFTSVGDFSAANGSGSALTITKIVSTTVFDCDISPSGKASFAGTGTLDLPEYNVAIYGQTSGWAAENLNSIKFMGGHSNWTLWGRSRNTQWKGFRHKQMLVVTGPGHVLGGIVDECFSGDKSAVGSNDNTVRIVGDGSIDVTRIGSRDFNTADSDTRISDDYGYAIERPLVSGGVAADGGPAKQLTIAWRYDKLEIGVRTELTGSFAGMTFTETEAVATNVDIRSTSSVISGPNTSQSSTWKMSGGQFIAMRNNTQYIVGEDAASDLRFVAGGAVGSGTEQFRINASSGNLARHVRPMANNSYDLGSASSQSWRDIFTQNAVTVTSDERTKDLIGGFPDEWLDAWGEVEWVRYKLKTAIAEKGDNARWHCGLIAQRVHAAFARHGVNAFEIGLVGWDAWPERRDTREVLVTRENGEQALETVVDIIPAGEEWKIRYTEAEALEAAWVRRELARVRTAA